MLCALVARAYAPWRRGRPGSSAARRCSSGMRLAVERARRGGRGGECALVSASCVLRRRGTRMVSGERAGLARWVGEGVSGVRWHPCHAAPSPTRSGGSICMRELAAAASRMSAVSIGAPPPRRQPAVGSERASASRRPAVLRSCAPKRGYSLSFLWRAGPQAKGAPWWQQLVPPEYWQRPGGPRQETMRIKRAAFRLPLCCHLRSIVVRGVE